MDKVNTDTSPKFLIYKDELFEEFRSRQANLVALVYEAAWLGRTLVVPSFNLAPQHNYGMAMRKQWSEYRSLDNSYVLIKTDTEMLKQRISYALIEDIEVDKEETLVIPYWHVINDEENTRYKLIIRDCADATHFMRELKFLSDTPLSPILKTPNETKPPTNISVILEFSEQVLELMNKTYSLLPKPMNIVHLRRGDIVQITAFPFHAKEYSHITCMKNVLSKVRDANIDGQPIYVMTNEQNPEYLKPLRQICEVYTFRDFPHLKSLVDGTGGQVDNNMLFAVEIALLSKANTAILISPKDYYYSVRKPASDTKIVGLSYNVQVDLRTRLVYNYATLFFVLLCTNPKRAKRALLKYMRNLSKNNVGG